MGLATFLRQHAAYGRGAYAVHKRRRDSGLVPRPEPSFYSTLARHVLRAHDGKLRLAALCTVSQAAAAVGYLLEAMASRWGLGTPRCLEP
jgi:hypothetical protein